MRDPVKLRDAWQPAVPGRWGSGVFGLRRIRQGAARDAHQVGASDGSLRIANEGGSGEWEDAHQVEGWSGLLAHGMRWFGRAGKTRMRWRSGRGSLRIANGVVQENGKDAHQGEEQLGLLVRGG
jgi:hypothetical protein